MAADTGEDDVITSDLPANKASLEPIISIGRGAATEACGFPRRTVAVSTSQESLSGYLGAIRTYPMLEPEEESSLARRWLQEGDREAAHRLITSHLRLVVKVAMRYRGYGLPMSEIVSEGNIGLIRAVQRFDPGRGARLATYALWWIKAAIQAFVLRSWSLVKIGTTANQKRLFFNLRRARQRVSALGDGDLSPGQADYIASEFGVSVEDVIEMNRRLGGDVSLNASHYEDDTSEWQDRLVAEEDSQEDRLADREEATNRRAALERALDALDARERRIFVARNLVDEPLTLEDLSAELGLSRERVRQIEARAFDKVQSATRAAYAGQGAATRIRPARESGVAAFMADQVAA
jgi:RNA polymerase sigma-32 factor